MSIDIFTGEQGRCHIQGIALDEEKGFIYYSFTTRLIKARLDGTVVGTVEGLCGHLGCIDFRKTDGKVYGSLEYKSDSIGRSIENVTGTERDSSDAFYTAVFDADKITRPGMDAEADGIMTAAYLKEVVDDYHGTGTDSSGNTVLHRYGCSGIDGTDVGPMPGETDGKEYLFEAYGIYKDNSRNDNDNQVILCYDIDEINKTAKPLSQLNLHKSGPAKPLKKLFLFTGNTSYGIQNLEYDSFTNGYFVSVYRGSKEQYPNFDLYEIDASVPPSYGKLQGLEEYGERLTLKKEGLSSGDICGRFFEYGTTGIHSFGDGRFLISEEFSLPGGNCSNIREYVYDSEKGLIKNYSGGKK